MTINGHYSLVYKWP